MSHEICRLGVRHSHVAVVEHAGKEIVNFLRDIHDVADPTHSTLALMQQIKQDITGSHC